MNTLIFDTPQAVAEAFARDLAQRIAAADQLTIALSGGSTPKLLFDHMAAEYADIDWSKVHLYWGDERCVPPIAVIISWGNTTLIFTGEMSVVFPQLMMTAITK